MASILHLGNIDFEESGGGDSNGCKIKNVDSLKYCSDFLKVSQ